MCWNLSRDKVTMASRSVDRGNVLLLSYTQWPPSTVGKRSGSIYDALPSSIFFVCCHVCLCVFKCAILCILQYHPTISKWNHKPDILTHSVSGGHTFDLTPAMLSSPQPRFGVSYKQLANQITSVRTGISWVPKHASHNFFAWKYNNQSIGNIRISVSWERRFLGRSPKHIPLPPP